MTKVKQEKSFAIDSLVLNVVKTFTIFTSSVLNKSKESHSSTEHSSGNFHNSSKICESCKSFLSCIAIVYIYLYMSAISIEEEAKAILGIMNDINLYN